MITGYEKPLDILPFDHRHSYITGVFHWAEPLRPDQVEEIVASKQVISRFEESDYQTARIQRRSSESSTRSE